MPRPKTPAPVEAVKTKKTTTRASNAAALTESRAVHKRLLAPLRAALRPVFDKMSYDQASRIIGDIPPWRIRRLLAGNAASPSYVDMTQIIVAAGFTPNQGAAIAGLWQPPRAPQEGDTVILDESQDPRVVYAVRFMLGDIKDIPADTREATISHLMAVIEGEKTLAKLRGHPATKVSRHVGAR